jgi:phage-related protein
MPSTARLLLEVTEKGTDEAKAKISDLNQHVDKTQAGFKNVGTSAGGFLTAGLVIGGVTLAAGFLSNAVGGVVDAFGESQRVAAQTNAVLTSTHGISGLTAKAVGDLATSLSNMSGIDDETVQSGENLMLTFTNIHKDVFPAATKAALDMSVAMGTDLQSTVMQVGKALQSPVDGVQALQRAGVKLSDGQKKQITDFMKVNDVASAQGVILGELNNEFGGSAKAAGDTMPGAMGKLHTALGNVQEKIGGGLAPALTKLAEMALNAATIFGNFMDFLGSHQWIIVALGIALGVVAVIIGTVLVPAFIAWAVAAGGAAIATTIAAAPILAIVAVIGILIAAIVLLVTHWDQVRAVLGLVMAKIGEFVGYVIGRFGDFFGMIGKGIGDLLGWFGNLPGRIGEALGSALGRVGQFKDSVINKLGELKDAAWNKMVEVANNIINAIASLPGRMVQLGKDIIQGIINGINSVKGLIGDAVHNATKDIPGIGGIIGKIQGHASGTISAPGGLSRLAENGMELIASPSVRNVAPGSRVFNHQETMDILGKGGGGTTINVYPAQAMLTEAGLAEHQRRVAVLYG